MNLTFGVFLDGAQWSDKQAALGEIRLGPAGMLEFLETRLGLTMPAVSQARRIDQYLGRMKACDKTILWCRDSFEADPWSTARQMLAWRDQLVAGGWNGELSASFNDAAASPRLKALAALEKISQPLDKGFEDRLMEVWSCLKLVCSFPIESVRFLDRLDILPLLWQKIFRRIEELGATLYDGSGMSINASGPTSLAHVQKALILTAGTGTFTPEPRDESLLLVEAEDEWQAAENLALWLAGGEDSPEEIAVICGDDTDILDHALKRQGLPLLGVSNASRWRAASQILPLTLSNAWHPIDVHRLVELLALPMSPVPGFASRHFLKALTQEPGVGGNAWKEALSLIVKDHIEHMRDKASSADSSGAISVNIAKEAEDFAAELDAMLAGSRFPPDEGIPEAELKQRCQWLVKRLAAQMGRGYDSLPAEAMRHAKEIQSLADGKGRLPRILLDRMVDSVIGMGGSNADPGRIRQASGWKVFSHPGQISAPVDTVIWWGFADSEAHHPEYWSRMELDVLKNSGVELEPGAAPRYREAEAWRRALLFARKRFLMFHFKRKDGQELSPHAFWDEICNVSDSQNLRRRCDELFYLRKDGNWQLAGRAAPMQKISHAVLTPVQEAYPIPPNLAAPKTLSYSQMSTLLGCPMKWALQYHSGLRSPDTLALPTGNAMIGNLCHRIVHEIYSVPARRVSPKEAADEASRLYDDLLPSMASELELEGNELENQRTKKTVVYAVRQLAESIGRLGLTVEKSEEKLESSIDGIPFVGYADLILRSRAGPAENAFVLDMKWTRSSRYKKEEFTEGRALQLASYAWLLKSPAPNKPDNQVHAGYFMLAQGELLSDSPLLGENALPATRSLDEIWDLASKAWDEDIQKLNEGTAEARGVMEAMGKTPETSGQNSIYVSPPCVFCDFVVLCGRNEI